MNEFLENLRKYNKAMRRLVAKNSHIGVVLFIDGSGHFFHEDGDGKEHRMDNFGNMEKYARLCESARGNGMSIKLWLDDVRPMPDDYTVWVKSAEDAEYLISKNLVTHISFDHDLGDNKPTGYDLASLIELLAQRGEIDPITWDIHSANPGGTRRIAMAMGKAESYWETRK